MAAASRSAAKARNLLGIAASGRGAALDRSLLDMDSSLSGLPKSSVAALGGLGLGDGLGTLARAPVVELHQMSVARALVCPVCTILAFLLVAAGGVRFMSALFTAVWFALARRPFWRLEPGASGCMMARTDLD